MATRQNVLAVILGGGAGSRLFPLTQRRSKPAVPLGGKASGGVKGLDDARMMIEAGATRIGASVGVKIAQEAAGSVSAPAAANAY